MKAEVEAHLRSLVNFPSPPGVATHIIDLARDPEIEMSKVAKALSLDSALSTKILRIANSPLYAQRRRSENLRQALVVLGLNATLTLALSFSLVKSLRGGQPNGISHPWYWRRALLAGTAARALADAVHHPLAEEIFLAGLLQDVGILALDQAIPDLYRAGESLQRDHTALADMEQNRLQTDHAAVGGWLMQSWNLPQRLHAAIRSSHQLEPMSDCAPTAVFERCVALSGRVADLFLLAAEERRFAETAQHAERILGLDRLAFGQSLATVAAMIPETEAIFETESLAAQHPDLVLAQAREVLMLRSLAALRELGAMRSRTDGADPISMELEEATRRDGLTGIYNRAHFDHVLARDFDDANRHDWPISVAFADLDRFDVINDNHGHDAGDRILKETARALRENTRESDLLARYGGDEFAVLFPATDADTARNVCEQIVTAVQDALHVNGSERATVTISVGCATHGGSVKFGSAAEFAAAADRALQAAKQGGRNQLVTFDRRLPGAANIPLIELS